MINKASGIILLSLVGITMCISVSDFYSFGGGTGESNQKLPEGDSGRSVVYPTQPVYFYGKLEYVFTVG